MADGTSGNWVTRQHPQKAALDEAQFTQRSSYIATRQQLIPFLVPHRFEGAVADPSELVRSQYGYGLGLNKSYLQDIFGHIRSAPTLWQWGVMEESGVEETIPTPTKPSGGLALTLWEDATRDNVTWKNFIQRKVLEWLLSSPGGFNLVDTPKKPDGTGAPTIEEAKALALRPYVQFIPWSQVEHWGRYDLGYKWIKIITEEEVTSDPKLDLVVTDNRVRILYQIQEDGSTEVSRWAPDGSPMGAAINLGQLVDKQGQVTLPFIPVGYGEREDLDYVGEGLIADLADIIIDLFNTWSETREGFRDATFALITHIGERGAAVQKLLEAGTRFVDLGDNDKAKLDRLAGDVEEVDKGLALMDFSMKAWDAAARTNAATAQAHAAVRSGVSLQAEFQLSLAPLLTEVAETLDQIESATMFMCGQFGGFEPGTLDNVGVKRGTEFRPEEETGRISRIIADFNKTGLPIPEEAQVEAIMAWAASIDIWDLDSEVALPEGKTGTLRELLKLQAQTAVAEAAVLKRNESAFLTGIPGAGGEVVVEPGEGDLPPL